MKRLLRLAVPAALALSLGACSISGLLGGGKVPPTLLTLTPETAAPGEFSRAANAGEAVTIQTPVIAKELRTIRVPVQVTPTDVAYIEDVQWVDTPDRLFQDLLAETLRRRTNRVVLAPDQATLDPGLIVTGQLLRFGFDEAEQAVIVRYDGALSTTGGTRVETRRFEARVSARGDSTIGPYLNRAANQVALEVATWIGGSRL
ncbi:MAG: ABC-type transport auxiliary lipoprotein family protein [Pseudomonadota bacterium]|nr:ABC-type transport auxiliary lipoprotein family protein [Pseudomonadota bacterium]